MRPSSIPYAVLPESNTWNLHGCLSMPVSACAFCHKVNTGTCFTKLRYRSIVLLKMCRKWQASWNGWATKDLAVRSSMLLSWPERDTAALSSNSFILQTTLKERSLHGHTCFPNIPTHTLVGFKTISLCIPCRKAQRSLS